MIVLRVIVLGLAASAAACHSEAIPACGDDAPDDSCAGADAGDGPVLFAERSRPLAVIADAEHVYWLEWGQLDDLQNYQPGALVRAPHGGGTPQVVVEDVSRPWWLAADDTHVYWSEQGRIARWPKAGGAPEVVIDGVSAMEIAVGATHVAWRQVQVEPGVYVAPKGGGEPFLIDPTEDADIVAVDATHVYFGYLGSVARAPIGGGAIDTLLSGQPSRLAVHGDVLYVGASFVITRVGLDGSDPVNLAFESCCRGPELAVGDDGLVFAFATAGDDWVLKRTGLTSGPATSIATETGDLRGIAVASGNLYWITAGAEDAPTGAVHHQPL